MTTKSFVIRRSFLWMTVGVVLIASGDRCMSQDADQKENELHQIQILLGAEGLNVVSPALNGQESGPTEPAMLPPGTKSLSELHSSGRRSPQRSNAETKYFREQISQQIDFLAQQGNDVQQLRELVEQLQLAQENSAQRITRDVEVAVFAVPEAAQEGPDGPQNAEPPRVGLSFTGPPPAGPQNFGPPNFGPPGFGPKGLRMGGRAEMQQGQGPQIQHPEAHSPEGPFAEDRLRIAALTESAERITKAGLPDVAHGLRERAGQLERELAEKQERMQQEERKRTESAMQERLEQRRQQPQRQQPQRLMEERREGFEIELGDHATPPLRELHGQLEQVRRDMHKLSEQMAVLTRLIQQHHNPKNDRGHHEDMDDDEDGDDEDGDDEDGDDEDGDDDDGDDDDEMDEDDEDPKERGEREQE